MTAERSQQPVRSVGALIAMSLFWLPLSLLTDGFTNIVLPSRLFDIPDASRAAVLGAISFVGLALSAAIQPVVGYVGDRLRPHVGRHGVLTGGVALVLIALLTFGTAPTLLTVALAYVVLQAGAAISQSALQAYLPDQVPRDRRGLGAGLKGFMDLVGATVGFVVLGALLAAGQVTTALLAAGAVTLGFFGLTVVLVREPNGGGPATGRGDWRAIFRIELPRDRPFVWVVAARFLFLLGIFAVGRFLYLVVADRLGLGDDDAAGTVGGLLAGLALLTGIAALPSGWLADRIGRRRVMAAGGLLAALGIAILASADGLLPILVGGGLMAVGSASFSAANWALTTDLVPSRESARYMGLANIGTAGAAAAAGLLGPLVDLSNGAFGSGYTLLFIAAAAACCASGLVSLRMPELQGAVGAAVDVGALEALGPTT
jgi:MFS family permease